jgi:hypothetical protein
MSGGMMNEKQGPWETMSQSFQDEYAQSFWTQETAAIEVAIGMPETKRGWKQLSGNFGSFLTSQLRRRAIEVSERSLDPEEKQKMNEAKQVEIKNFISAKALEAIPAHLQPDKQAAMRMRWILTWKRDDSGGQRAKARCVILGYMDPQYEHRQEASPTMTRTSRQVMLAVSASLGFGVWKGDVSEAFLQGREYKGESFVIPTDDICDAMGIPAGSVTRLKKACYGLVDAILEWFLTVSEFLISIGFEKCACDRVTLVVSSLWKAEYSSVWLVVMWMILCFVVYLDVRHGKSCVNKFMNVSSGALGKKTILFSVVLKSPDYHVVGFRWVRPNTSMI